LIEDIILEENKKGDMCNLNNSRYGSSKKVSNKYNFMNKGKILEQSDSNAFFKKLKTNEALKYIKGEILF